MEDRSSKQPTPTQARVLERPQSGKDQVNTISSGGGTPKKVNHRKKNKKKLRRILQR